MAKKKPVKGQAKSKKRFAIKPKVKIKEVPMGFFARLKDVLPEQRKETVRVKTFIVEKPVYVSAPEQRILPPAQKYQMNEEDEERFDSRRSRYLKRKQMEADLDNDSLDDSEPVAPAKKGKKQIEENFDQTEEESPVGEEEQEGEVDEFGEPVDGELGETGEDNLEEGAEGVPIQQANSHTRSRAMFLSVWWKKAIFWAILFWLVIMLIDFAMWILKLNQGVELSRQWWMVLAVLIVVLMIYFKFFEGKLKI